MGTLTGRLNIPEGSGTLRGRLVATDIEHEAGIVQILQLDRLTNAHSSKVG